MKIEMLPIQGKLNVDIHDILVPMCSKGFTTKSYIKGYLETLSTLLIAEKLSEVFKGFGR